MRVLAAAAVLMVAAPALAQGYSRPDIIRGLCQKDGCDEFVVLSADRLRGDDEGTLFKTRIRTYHASSQGRVEKGDDTGYVFCSPTKPTILAESEGKIAGFQIATAPSQETRETKRQQSNFYSMYFTICHGPEAGRAAVHDLEGVAQRYGYRSPLAKSVMVSFTNPEEVFSRPPQRVKREADERAIPERPLRDTRSDDLVPPRAIPDVRERPVQGDGLADRRREERVVERRVIRDDEEVVIVKKRRPAPDDTPWYRQPQRWIENLNPF